MLGQESKLWMLPGLEVKRLSERVNGSDTQTQMSYASQPEGRPAGQDSGTMRTLSKTEREREREK